jgi:hypothetical protein
MTLVNKVTKVGFSIKGGKLLDQLSDCQLLTDHSAPLN